MNEIGSSEELMDTIEKLLDVFGDAIAPQCVSICARLCQEFNRLFVVGDDDDEAAMTCIGIIRTMQTLLYASRNLEENIRQMEMLIVPCLARTMTKDTVGENSIISSLSFSLSLWLFESKIRLID
jgi:hypothetical protein